MNDLINRLDILINHYKNLPQSIGELFIKEAESRKRKALEATSDIPEMPYNDDTGC